MIVEPRIRPDGLCLECGGPRAERPEGAYATVARYECEPFCSAVCAKNWHGTSLGSGICSLYHNTKVAA